ncbi:MAG TPA: L,D-transpeptidase [Anaerolinea sp.]|nr:L,D-transpeptidase [Anaerolinea sp.]
MILPVSIFKRGLAMLPLAVALILLAPGGHAQAAADPGQEPYTGEALCLPDEHPSSDCLAYGPSAQLNEWAKTGLTYPPRPLPARHPAADLTTNPAYIAKINLPATEPAPLYATLDDAVAGTNSVGSIAAGKLRYVSFVDVQRVNDKAYVMLKSGEWMRASPAAYPYFQGLLFSRNPSNSFGWLVDNARARSAPGYASPEVGDLIYRETAVQIYQKVSQDGTDWYQIGFDRWMERRYIRQVVVNPTPPKGVDNNRWIEVNLYEQTLTVYENGQLLFATMVASGGEPFYTRPGLFKIYQKKPLETMQGAFEADRSDFYYLQDVPWTMYFDQARALHGAYWRAWVRFAGAHGCVNLSIGDSAWLYQWANEGDWVYVWDPSGQTPTDPSLYTAGGA